MDYRVRRGALYSAEARALLDRDRPLDRGEYRMYAAQTLYIHIQSGQLDTGDSGNWVFWRKTLRKTYGIYILVASPRGKPSSGRWRGAAGSRDEPGPPQLRGAQREPSGRGLVSLCLAEGPLELADGQLVAASVDELAQLPAMA